MPVKPFEKGNPYGKLGGRPKGSSYVALCKEWSEKRGGSWDILFAWAQGQETRKGKTRIVAKELRKFAVDRILAYGYGKPRESIDLNNSDGSITSVLRAFVAAGSSAVSGDSIRPAGKVLNRSGRDKPVGKTT